MITAMQRSPNIRVRLLFDDCTSFRPGSVGRRKCWFLLNIDACRRITDVEYCIQRTFCLGRSAQIELLLDDFVLPPFEKSEIIQENDLIRVRLLSVGDKQDEIEIEEPQVAEPSNPSKKKKASTEAQLPRSNKDNVAYTPTAKRKKTLKERKVTSKERRRDNRLMNQQKTSQGKEITEAGQTSRLDNSLCGLDISPPGKNGTKIHSARARKHFVKTSLGHDSSSSSDSSSEDDRQPKVISKANPSGRRKGQPSKSLTQSSTQALSMNPGTSASGGSGNKRTKANARNIKSNGSGPLHSNSESSSTEEETVRRNSKPSLKTSGSGYPSKTSVTGSIKSSDRKRTAMTKTSSTSTSSSVSSLSSASSSSDPDESPPMQLQQKQTVQSSTKPGAALLMKTAELPNHPVERKGLSSSKSAVVRKSKSKSSVGHVRFSSDCDSDESETEDGMQPSVPERVLSAPQPVQQLNLEQRTSPVKCGANKSNSVVQGELLNATDEVQEVGSECDNNHFTLDQDATNGIATDGIQTKLLNIAGQKSSQPMKPKQPRKLAQPKKPKKPKDYTSYLPLVGPPRVGDIIAYKILELSTLYTPEVSEYKEGEVINFNHSNSMIELRLSDVAMAAEPKRDGGKFEMETEDDLTDQPVPSPVDRLVLVTLPSLIEPKLIT